MSEPVPALVPLAPAPLPSDSDAQFNAKAFPLIASWNPSANSVSAIALSAKANAEFALAAAIGGDLPPITGKAGQFLRVNAGETGAEFAPVDLTKATTAEAEAGTGTGLMDPVLTAAAIEALSPQRVYDYQEFLISGTWTKPTNAESGDKVVVQVIGAGGSGARTNGGNRAATGGGGGGGGVIYKFEDIDILGATEPVEIGAGASSRSSNGNGGNGGQSSFGEASTIRRVSATGGQLGRTDGNGSGGGTGLLYNAAAGGTVDLGSISAGGVARTGIAQLPGSSIWGGGGGGNGADADEGGASAQGGHGGSKASGATADGIFPGGGGAGAASGSTGAGADGVVRVWCIRE